MNQDYEKARSWVEKVEKEIKDMQQKKEEERLTVPGMPTGTGSAHVSSLPPPAPDATSAPVATN